MPKSFEEYIKENAQAPTNDEQYLRACIKAEQDAIMEYKQYADKTQNKRVKKLLLDIAQEEAVHAHEFQLMLQELQASEYDAMKKAAGEKEDLGI